jgi:hypothetical protein
MNLDCCYSSFGVILTPTTAIPVSPPTSPNTSPFNNNSNPECTQLVAIGVGVGLGVGLPLLGVLLLVLSYRVGWMSRSAPVQQQPRETTNFKADKPQDQPKELEVPPSELAIRDIPPLELMAE